MVVTALVESVENLIQAGETVAVTRATPRCPSCAAVVTYRGRPAGEQLSADELQRLLDDDAKQARPFEYTAPCPNCNVRLRVFLRAPRVFRAGYILALLISGFVYARGVEIVLGELGIEMTVGILVATIVGLAVPILLAHGLFGYAARRTVRAEFQVPGPKA